MRVAHPIAVPSALPTVSVGGDRRLALLYDLVTRLQGADDVYAAAAESLAADPDDIPATGRCRCVGCLMTMARLCT